MFFIRCFPRRVVIGPVLVGRAYYCLGVGVVAVGDVVVGGWIIESDLGSCFRFFGSILWYFDEAVVGICHFDGGWFWGGWGEGAVCINHVSVCIIGVDGGCWLVGGPICGVVVVLLVEFDTMVEVAGSPFVSGRISV